MDQYEQQVEREIRESNLGGAARDTLARNIDHEVGDFIDLQLMCCIASDVGVHNWSKHTLQPRD